MPSLLREALGWRLMGLLESEFSICATQRRMYIPAVLRACVLVPEFEPGLDELTSLPRLRRRRQFLRRSEVSNHPELVRIGR